MTDMQPEDLPIDEAEPIAQDLPIDEAEPVDEAESGVGAES
jgi:hypothetical protein